MHSTIKLFKINVPVIPPPMIPIFKFSNPLKVYLYGNFSWSIIDYLEFSCYLISWHILFVNYKLPFQSIHNYILNSWFISRLLISAYKVAKQLNKISLADVEFYLNQPISRVSWEFAYFSVISFPFLIFIVAFTYLMRTVKQ